MEIMAAPLYIHLKKRFSISTEDADAVIRLMNAKNYYYRQIVDVDAGERTVTVKKKLWSEPKTMSYASYLREGNR